MNSHHDSLSRHTPSTSLNPSDLQNNKDSIHTLFSLKPKSSSCFYNPASDLIEDENNVNDDYYLNYPNDDNNPNDDDYYIDEENNIFDEEDEEEDENEDDTNWKEDFFALPEIVSDGDDEVFITKSLNDVINSE